MPRSEPFLSARVDPTGARAFDVEGDLRLYAFLRFYSLRDARSGIGTGLRSTLGRSEIDQLID